MMFTDAARSHRLTAEVLPTCAVICCSTKCKVTCVDAAARQEASTISSGELCLIKAEGTVLL